MTAYEVPLSAANQRFTIQLGQVDYTFALTYRDVPEGGWVLDIADSAGAPIVAGIPLVTGADLLAQYAHLGIGGSLYVITDADPGAIPTFTNLGSASRLYFVGT